MRKRLSLMIICVLAIIVAVGAVLVVKTMREPRVASYSVRAASAEIVPVGADASDSELTDYVRLIISVMADRDFAALSGAVHEELGVMFSPYSTISLTGDCRFTASQIADFRNDTKKYIWGVYDVGGDLINMTPTEYFDEFVFDAEFTSCENFGVDKILRSGNALENVSEVFPNARFVDCYMPGTSDSDWKILRLVFEEKDGFLYLTAIVHSEYTI